jgi:hypothetical protein
MCFSEINCKITGTPNVPFKLLVDFRVSDFSQGFIYQIDFDQ